MSDDAPNALGLEFSQLTPEADQPTGVAPASPGSINAELVRKEKKPYVNPDRFRTGGAQRVIYFFSFFFSGFEVDYLQGKII